MSNEINENVIRMGVYTEMAAAILFQDPKWNASLKEDSVKFAYVVWEGFQSVHMASCRECTAALSTATISCPEALAAAGRWFLIQTAFTGREPIVGYTPKENR